MKGKKIFTILLASILAFGMVGCSGTTSTYPGTVDKDMITINVLAEPTNINSLYMTDNISQSILAHCMSGFTRLDENDMPVADLAESWDINEDKTEYVMHLRKDAKWSNGDQVTVNDFYYAWVQQMTESTGALYASYLYNHIKNGEDFYNGKVDESKLGLKVIDDYTLKIEWAHPMNNGLFYLSQAFYYPINQKAYESIGDENYAKDADKMVTNGAYTITEWVHDDHLTMEKSKDYYDAANIKINKVKLAMIADSNTSFNAFKAGEIDVTNLYSEQIEEVEKADKSVISSYIDGGTWYLDFNTKDKNLSNANLRKALTYSVDVQSLLDNVINDGSVAADGFVPSNIVGADGKSYAESRGSLYAYDKEKAVKYFNEALKELGLTKDQLKLTFIQTDSTYNQNQAAYLQQQWKQNLGLDVTLKTLSSNAAYEAQVNGDFSFTVGAWGASENDAISFLENYQTGFMNNFAQFSNKEYDSLIAQCSKESDNQKRQELLIKAEKILIDNMIVGPMYFTRTTYAVSSKVEGLVKTPFQLFGLRKASIK